MTFRSRSLRCLSVSLLTLGIVWSCGFDGTLREYLSTQFWLPFVNWPAAFKQLNVKRISAPFAGMIKSSDARPLTRLRKAYQSAVSPSTDPFVKQSLAEALTAARAEIGLTPREQEELNLLDAKIALRTSESNPVDRPGMEQAKAKLTAFLKTSKIPEFRSEARGWLGRVHFLLDEQSAAGKIYLDELTTPNSNLSEQTLVSSLRIVYGYDGGQKLLEQFEDYFDTAEHAAFALEVLTNPHWHRWEGEQDDAHLSTAFPRVKQLLRKHAHLFNSPQGADRLAILSLHLALRMGELTEALAIANRLPEKIRRLAAPDLLWMLASTYFLNRQYQPAEAHLLTLFRSRHATEEQKAAAAYGLCGVYWKAGRTLSRLRYALWLQQALGSRGWSSPTQISDMSLYWASSGWDLNMILEFEASVEILRNFAEHNPGARVVKYALAVRLSREHQYDEAARIYESIYATRRAPRMRKLAQLYAAASQPGPAQPEAKYAMAEYLSQHSTQIYFNDNLWSGLQNYALQGRDDLRLTRAEREALLKSERQLRDQQEEYWQAYLLCREVIDQAKGTELSRRAAQLGLKCLRRINIGRFGRESEIHAADAALTVTVRAARAPLKADLSVR